MLKGLLKLLKRDENMTQALTEYQSKVVKVKFSVKIRLNRGFFFRKFKSFLIDSDVLLQSDQTKSNKLRVEV